LTEQAASPTEHRYWARVRYGKMKHRAPFAVDDRLLRRGDQCVVRSVRGIELGVLITEPEPDEPAAIEESSSGCSVLRKVTPRDAERQEQIATRDEPEEFEFCLRKIEELGLPIKLLRAEHLFAGRKLVFYYTADGRVDFRQLVRQLAAHFKTRIEMRQIGVRDAARLLEGVGICGRELCCSSWLEKMPPVTIKMAKVQGRPLAPERNCGVCGRLRCCLRYELDDATSRDLE